MSNHYKGYTPTIGLEIHAELKTQTKMFCACKNAPHESTPNAHICPICMGHPGTLPTVNKKAVQHVLMVGHAVSGTLATYTEFDRKNYFYPDIPKGYQISQYEYPLVRGGSLADVAITRVHLEEDTARSLHDQSDESLIDFNRAGVPLMELVTEPVMHDAKTAGMFARELQLLLRTLGVSDANMEKGEMRVEANISVSNNEKLGTKVEVKNLNSFKAVESAIQYEIKRQVEALEKGNTIVQETRGWNENTSKTFSQRKKESSHDYRYFPDPDMPKIDITQIDEFKDSRLSEIMPELPYEKRKKYTNLGLSQDYVEVLVASPELATFFDTVIVIEDDTSKMRNIAKIAANYLITDVLGYLRVTSKSISIQDASPAHFRALLVLLEKKAITSRVAKNILVEAVFEGKDPNTLVQSRGLLQADSSTDLLPIVDTILNEHTSVVDEYINGKEPALQFLIGQGMKKTKGTADPEVLKTLILERIN